MSHLAKIFLTNGMDDGLWGQLPSELRNAIRRQADLRTWSAMNRAEPASRRQDSALAPAFLQRLSNLMTEFDEYRTCITLREERISLRLLGGNTFVMYSSERPNNFIGSREEVLSLLTPVIRRASEQQLKVYILQLRFGSPVAVFESPSFRLTPRFAYLDAFREPPIHAKSAFLERLKLMLVFLNDRDDFVPYYGADLANKKFFIEVNDRRVGEPRLISYLQPDRLRVSYMFFTDESELQTLDQPAVLRLFGESYDDDTTLAMRFSRYLNSTTIEEFNPPSYNPVLHPAWL